MSWIHTPSYASNVESLAKIAEIENDTAKKFLDFVDKSKGIIEISPITLLNFIKHAKALGIKYAFKLSIKDKYFDEKEEIKNKLEEIAIESIYNLKLPNPQKPVPESKKSIHELVSEWNSLKKLFD